jgi:nitrogen fixation/metabolism regulation signal transduction histidine kinase
VVADVKTHRALATRMVVHCMLFMVVGGLLASVNEYMANATSNTQVLLESLTRNFLSFACTVIALLPLLIYDSMKLSNRIVGPICRLRDTIRKISRNQQVPPLSFRTHDYWEDLPKEFNAMIERLRSDVTEPVEPVSKVSDWAVRKTLASR